MSESVEWSVAGRKLRCPVCEYEKFWYRTTLMNTRAATFFNMDWANKNAVNFVCGRCGHVLWFLDPPIDRTEPQRPSDDWRTVSGETRATVLAVLRSSPYKLAGVHIQEVKGTPFPDKYLANTIEGTLVVDLSGLNPDVKAWNEDTDVREWLMEGSHG